MKTRCYCIYCPLHPLHKEQNNFKNILTGWDVGYFIGREYTNQGKDVDCLQPNSAAFIELNKDPEEFSYSITAYGDGEAITGFEGNGYMIRATCEKEKYEEL